LCNFQVLRTVDSESGQANPDPNPTPILNLNPPPILEAGGGVVNSLSNFYLNEDNNV